MNTAVVNVGRDFESDAGLQQENPGSMRNGLHLRSAPGVCALFAGVLLLVGIGVAVGGYWPHGGRRTSPHHPSSGRTPAEKLKLVGPIIMGVGLFIFICANTLLYEDRKQRRMRSAPERSARRIRNFEQFSQMDSNPQVTTELINSGEERTAPPPIPRQSPTPPQTVSTPPELVLNALREPLTPR